MQSYGSVSCARSGKLVLIRHGTSVFNKNHQFTGWLDPQVCFLLIRGMKKNGKVWRCIRLLRPSPVHPYQNVLSEAAVWFQFYMRAFLRG